ncbi:MAG: RNA polymerase sigma factor [Planctomycetota bacterium]
MNELMRSQEDDIALVERFRKGSKDAFEQIVKRYMKESYFIALGLVGNHDDALDLSQEAFCRAYCNIQLLNSNQKFFPWFYQILRNLCFSHLRRGKRRHTVSLSNSEMGAGSLPSREEFSPELVCERNERKEAVWKAMGQLSEKHREIIILRHFQHLSYDEIAGYLHCTRGTVMSRLYHARKKLKELLTHQKGGQL